ncbi:hypothetical protein B0A50_00544 [Salinomyces thailandicus]|uniref:F-box domain-containing protein n=1 Tax=Salinomyces thailandicus TaxID=706561 RepID=A0A4U0UDX1_9PEZI|nr:hypothetical protein B0A50_00544 [Salinomyces thailandica]
MSSAAERTFALPELCSLVLVNLDMKTLLLAQRTCKTFHATIMNSPPLLRKLWLLPEEPFAAQGPATTKIQDQPRRQQACRLNPLLLINRHRLRLAAFHLWGGEAKAPRTIVDLHFRSLEDARRLPPEGSWSRMLVVQPHSAEATWSLEAYGPPRGEGRQDIVAEGRRLRGGKRGRTRAVAYKYSVPPTLGEVRNDLVEKFGGQELDETG